jgi:hypothetical protein
MDPSLFNVHCLEWPPEVFCSSCVSWTFLSAKSKFSCQRSTLVGGYEITNVKNYERYVKHITLLMSLHKFWFRHDRSFGNTLADWSWFSIIQFVIRLTIGQSVICNFAPLFQLVLQRWTSIIIHSLQYEHEFVTAAMVKKNLWLLQSKTKLTTFWNFCNTRFRTSFF